MKLRNKIILSIAFLVLSIFIYQSHFKKNREIKYVSTIDVTDNAKDFRISTDGIMIFDGINLYFLDKNANKINTVNSKDRELECFFVNNYAFLYDKDLKKIYQYSEDAELINTIKIEEDLYNVTYNNKNIIFHTKTPGFESLSSLKPDGEVVELYKTENTILTYDVYKENNFSVAEVKYDATGYKNILTTSNNGERTKENFSQEAALYLYREKNRTIMATDKNLYIINGEEKISAQIPNISDIKVMDRSIYILHSSILSKYNLNLEEKSKNILAANLNKLSILSNSIYANGSSDIAGEIGNTQEFYTRLGTSFDKIEISGLTVGAMKNGKINIYAIVNQRNADKTVNNLEPQGV